MYLLSRSPHLNSGLLQNTTGVYDVIQRYGAWLQLLTSEVQDLVELCLNIFFLVMKCLPLRKR
jgi:hypothetical protein